MTDLRPELLGFSLIDQHTWEIESRGRRLVLRSLFNLDDLEPIDDLQREALGTSEYDLIPASELVVVPETGGHVLAAYDAESNEMIAAGFAWGGFFEGRSRIVSDFLGVRKSARSFGIGETMKRLQAAIAFAEGFEEIVWTVDPLRAANARLNFAKLGAVCRHYERNRYGEAFGEAHYGGLPTDRLHVTWPIRSTRVFDRLTGQSVDASSIEGDTRFVSIPDDIDSVLAVSRDEALRWRLDVRTQIESLFAEGWEIDGFALRGERGPHPALILHHRS